MASNSSAAPRGGFLSGSRRYFALPAAERRTWRHAWWRLLVVDLSLRLRPARTLARALAAPEAGEAAGTSAATEALARALAAAAAHHLWPMRCLQRSVALRLLLEARGIPSQLRIGVRREGGRLAAHAWVEVGGRAVGEPEAVEGRFLPLLAERRGG